ncbi:MAG: hypothetical protein Q7O66_21635 [Dehalococcoidia bacterium]|nr:hypothetical protein [Dehalococcoidia bacterium]
MTRVDELQKKYPNVPREVIVKLDALTLGIRDSDAFDNIGHWARSGGVGTYQSYDRELPRLETRPGYVKRLGAFQMKNGLGARIERDSTSPYEIRELDSGQFALFEGEEKVQDIYFPQKPWPFAEQKEPLTSSGTPVTSLVNLKAPHCFGITPVRHCEYFSLGEQCKFCNYDATQEGARTAGAIRAITVKLDEVVEAYKILSSNVRLLEGLFQMGAFKDADKEASLHLDFVERVAKEAPYKPVFTANCQPMSRKNMQRLKDAGLDCVIMNIEVWDRHLFEEICPGKTKRDGYDWYLEALVEAVDVFGAGNVATAFVGGATMIPDNGHRTWQEARDSTAEGVEWAIKNGMMTIYTSLRLGPGSVYGDDKSKNLAKLAPTEFYLDLSVGHHESAKKHGLYQHLNKLMFCPMDCLDNHYAGELGIVELAGDPGKWLSDTIPDKANWLSQFVASLESPAKVQ